MIQWMAFVYLNMLAHVQGLSQFTVQPESVVQAEGLEAVFECLYPEALTHSWGLNGVFFADTNFPLNVARFAQSRGSPARLIIQAIPQYNNTVVLCQAVIRYSNGSLRGILSSSGTLHIQGHLQPVSNLHFDKDSSTSTTITISWDPPFSLNLTTAEPDIQYCVDVYNVTGGGDDLECIITVESIRLLSQCLVQTTYYFHPQTDPYLQQLHCFVVTSRSNVPNATNGSQSNPVSGYIRLKPPTIPSESLSYQTDAGLSFITWMFPSVILSVPPRNPPTEYRVEIMSIDDPESPLMCSCLARSEVIGDTITLALQWCSTCVIQRHRIYNYTIAVVNEVGESVSTPIPLSTHDVQDLRVLALYFNTTTSIEVTCSFLTRSTPSGILAVVQSQTSDSDVHYAVGERSGNQTRVIIDGLSGGVYNVVVYDRGEDRLPEEWPAGSQTVYVQNQHNMNAGSPNFMTALLPAPEVVFMAENGLVCIRCILTPPVFNACIVVVYHKVLGQKLQVYSINRSNTSECFLSNKEDFNIAVFGLLHDGLERIPAYTSFITANSSATDNNMMQPFPSSSTAVIITAVVGSSLILLFVTLLLCTLILWIWSKHRYSIKQAKHTKQAHLEKIFHGIDTKQNEAYDLVKTLTMNEAYNMVDIDRTTSINARPLPMPTPAPVCDVQPHSTPSPPHIYEEPRLTESANVEPETISRPSHVQV